MSGHVRERNQTSEGRTQLTTHHPSGRQLLNPSPLQTDEDVHIPRLCSPELQTCPIQNNKEITREQVHSETLGRRNVSRQSGSASTLTEVNASAKDATTSEVSAVCTVHCTVEVPESQFSGWRPVWLTANLGTARCRERKNPKGGQTREGGWEQKSSSRLTLVFLVFPLCVGVATPRVLQTLCGKSAKSACN